MILKESVKNTRERKYSDKYIHFQAEKLKNCVFLFLKWNIGNGKKKRKKKDRKRIQHLTREFVNEGKFSRQCMVKED